MIIERFQQRRLQNILYAIKCVCKEEEQERVLKRCKELEKQVNERVQATQNSASLYQQRINQLEQQVIEKD